MKDMDRWVKSQFPVLTNNPDLAYLDSGATTQKPEQVIWQMGHYNRHQHANIHRGVYDLSQKATEAYDQVRQQVKYFIHATRDEEIVFTKGTTESLNLLAFSYGLSNLKKDDEVVISLAEHHSNIVPWQQVVALTGAKLKYLPVDQTGKIDLESLERVITQSTKIVSVTMVSNAFGTIQPIKEVIERAHEVGAVAIVDAAQAIAHTSIDVQGLGADFLAFSGHKMYGPTGVGVLYGRYDLLDQMVPYQTGGDMIEYVEQQSSTFAPVPTKFEAGTPNIEGVIGLGEAIRFMDQIGFSYIHQREQELTEYAMKALKSVPYIEIYGPVSAMDRGPVIAFNIEGVHSHDVTTILDSDRVAIRAGHHCAQPLMKAMGLNSTCRISMAVYSQKEDVDRCVKSLKKVRGWLGYGS